MLKEGELMIYTHDEAARLVDMFEDILVTNGICVPSPEDYERHPVDMLGLYGSTYSDLIDGVENVLIDIIDRLNESVSNKLRALAMDIYKNQDVVTYIFSGTK